MADPSGGAAPETPTLEDLQARLLETQKALSDALRSRARLAQLLGLPPNARHELVAGMIVTRLQDGADAERRAAAAEEVAARNRAHVAAANHAVELAGKTSSLPVRAHGLRSVLTKIGADHGTLDPGWIADEFRRAEALATEEGGAQ